MLQVKNSNRKWIHFSKPLSLDPSMANVNGEDFMASIKLALKYGERDPLMMQWVLVLADP